MNADLSFCMSSYLMYRTIIDKNKTFKNGVQPYWYDSSTLLQCPIVSSVDLYEALKQQVANACQSGNTALALSGGIDSAILAKFMPKGSTAYTFRCVVPGMQVTDESIVAAQYAKECGLVHKIIDIYWEDFEQFAPVLMRHKGQPLHSIEIQIYKAAIQAKLDGFSSIIFGETADINYGGHSKLLSRDWEFGEFVDRFSFVLPYKIIKNAQLILEPFMDFEYNGYIDTFNFLRKVEMPISLGFYQNACDAAGIELITPYANTHLVGNLDIKRIREGENKYIVRELFARLYPNFMIPDKVPMPRATNEWFRNWEGPHRSEFWMNCVEDLSGDQRWQVWCLEKFLDILDGK